MTPEGSETRQPVPEEDSGPPRPHTPSLAEELEDEQNASRPSEDAIRHEKQAEVPKRKG